METKADALPSQTDQKLQQKFNQWAAAGRGDEMEDRDSDITEQTLALMDIQPGFGRAALTTKLREVCPDALDKLVVVTFKTKSVLF